MIGKKIKELRTNRGLLQQDLASILTVSKSTIAMWETEKRMPDTETLKLLADFFNVTVDYFVCDSIKFDFVIHDSCQNIICPICSNDTISFVKTITVDFGNEKSTGFAAKFICEEGHSFYQVFESYKGYTYTAFTDNLTVLSKINTDDIDYESAPYNLANAARADNLMEKYSVLDEHGKEAVESITIIEYKRYLNQQPDDEENLIDLRFYAYTAVSAGAGLYDDNNEYPTVKRVPDNAITRDADFCCYVNGHSMEPMYYDGDLICVKSQPSVEIGEIGIFVLNSEMYIKKLGANELISLNSDYPNIKNSPDIKCQGKVLGKI